MTWWMDEGKFEGCRSVAAGSSGFRRALCLCGLIASMSQFEVLTASASGCQPIVVCVCVWEGCVHFSSISVSQARILIDCASEQKDRTLKDFPSWCQRQWLHAIAHINTTPPRVWRAKQNSRGWVLQDEPCILEAILSCVIKLLLETTTAMQCSALFSAHTLWCLSWCRNDRAVFACVNSRVSNGLFIEIAV